MKKYLFLTAFAGISLFYACGEGDAPAPVNSDNNQKDTTNTDTIQPDPCANVQVTYIEINDVIKDNCTGGCHDIGAAGIYLNTFEQVKQATESGSLIGAIKHEAGRSPMPKGRAKLSDQQIQLFECWIAKGYPQG